MTMAAVARARQVVVLASGAGKAEALGRAFGADVQPDPSIPASLLAVHAEEVVVLCDAPAATGLPVPAPGA